MLITLLIMAFIFIQSALPADLSEEESGVIAKAIASILGTELDSTSFMIRKCAHFMEYLCLGVSLRWTVRDMAVLPDKAVSLLFSWIIGTVYAVTDELHQAFVPGRSCELRDVIIDGCGVAAGILLAVVLSKRRINGGRQ